MFNAVWYPFELLRFIPLCTVMGYAAYCDWRTGKVSNKVWRYALIGGAFTIIETATLFNWALFYWTLFIIVGSILVGFGFFLIGNGGADSKAFMMLGISAPLVPLWSVLWPIPLPFLAMLLGTVAALPYLVFRKSDVPLMKRKIRFLPFLFIGLIICVII